MKYAGIGSRETPQHILTLFEQWGCYLANNGLVLRSGHARGADQAFELTAGAQKEIFIPNDAKDHWLWRQTAKEYHPNWSACSEYAQLCHARNCAIIMGPQLNDLVDFVICWTKDGGETGGTGQALRIAKDYNIPIFNYFYSFTHENLCHFLHEKGLR